MNFRSILSKRTFLQRLVETSLCKCIGIATDEQMGLVAFVQTTPQFIVTLQST